MSVETLVNNVIDTAIHQAVYTTGQAATMVNDAMGLLNHYTPVYPTERVEFAPKAAGWSLMDLDFVQTKDGAKTKGLIPPPTPHIRTPNLPEMGDLVELEGIQETFNVGAPAITVPRFSTRTPSDLPAFTQTAPVISTDIKLPTAPSIRYPDKPRLATVNTALTVDALAVPAHDFSRPAYQAAPLDSWATLFGGGQQAVAGMDSYARSLLAEFHPDAAANYALLSERVSGVLAARSSALGTVYDEALFQQAARKAEDARQQAIHQVDAASQMTGWDLPGAVRFAGQVRLETDYANALGAAALAAYTQRAEQEVKHLQFTLDLANRMHDAATDLFTKGCGLALEAVKASIAYAEAAGSFAVKVYQLRQADFEMELKILDADTRIFEALLKAELAKAEITRARLDIERLKSDVNRDLVAIYTAELSAADVQARVYATQLGALEQEVKIRQLPLEVFIANVRAYAEQVNAKRGEYALLEAQISGDKAKLEGELAKLKAYEIQANVFRTVVEAEATKIKADAERNNLILEEYKTKVHTELALVQIDETIAKHSLDAYEIMAKVYLAEVDSALKQAQFDFDTNLESSKLALAQREFEFEAQFKASTLEMSRVKAISEISQAGAQTFGSMANAALSAMNGVASATVS